MPVGNEDNMYAVGPSVQRELVLGVAATLLFFTSALMIPVVGFLAGVFTPLPTLITFYRFGSPLGYWIPGGAVALGSVLLLFLGMPFSIPYLLEMVFLGLFLGTGMRMGWSTERTIGSASLLVFVAGAFLFWFTNGGPQGTLMSQVENEFKQAVTAVLDQYAGTTLDRSLIDESVEQFIPVMVRLLPGFSLGTSILIAWLNVMIALRYCRIHHVILPPWPAWNEWKAPEVLVWGLIGAGFALLASSGSARIVCFNILVVLSIVYLLQGLAIVAFYLDKWKLPRLLRAIIYGFLLLQQFATLAAVFLGIFDMWFDFRRVSRKPSPPGQSPE